MSVYVAPSHTIDRCLRPLHVVDDDAWLFCPHKSLRSLERDENACESRSKGSVPGRSFSDSNSISRDFCIERNDTEGGVCRQIGPDLLT